MSVTETIAKSTSGDTLADVLSLVLDKGVVITGDIQIKLADVDLLTIKIRLLIAGVDKAKDLGIDWWEKDPYLSSKAREIQAVKEKEELEKRVKQLEAKVAKKGELIPMVIVLDPEAMSMFIHETLGHSSEGDHVRAGESYLPTFRGKRIAPRGVTIVDSPKRFSTLGSYPFDDEGTLPQTVYVLEDGVVRDYLTDRSSSTSLHVKPTGNSRSFWYDATPKVRMSNFVMLAGARSLASVLSEVNDGLLIKGMREGGSNERTGDFHFKPNIAYKVRDGELKEAILIPEIKGNALDYLNAITEVSSEWSLCVAGCGKPTPQTDYVWVGYGAPFVKFDRRL